MGKTPKKAAPGGDERNLYVRRLKATTVPSKASESNLPERQRESENSNRPKLSGIQKKNPGTRKNFKSKLRPPAKIGLNQTTRQLKLPMKNPEAKTANMQPELEETEVKLNIPIQKENVTEEKNLQVEESTIDKEHINNASEQMPNELETSPKVIREVISISEEKVSLLQEKEGISSENIGVGTKEVEEQEDNDIKLTFEAEQNSSHEQEEKLNDKRPNDDSKEELPAVQDELKNGIKEKEQIQSDNQMDTESYSVHIVESTTSEIPEASGSIAQSDIQKDKEKLDDALNNDASFISYDSSIMLKDVQIRLNDCLKDNSKLFDPSNMDDTRQLSEDMSFGKTLRNISGRHSINRMRHITLCERRISPNSSLFVNTSTISIPQDEGTEAKVLHYTSGLLSDSYPTNGSPLDRKRKIETANWSSAKKQKSDEESSLLNTSMNLLKSWRRPMQISTPKATSYKFDSTKLDLSGIKDDDNKLMAETTESTKKWCVIM